MTAPTMTPTVLAAMLTSPPQSGPCTCIPTAVCPAHRAQYPGGPVRCRANCGEPLDPALWPHSLHALCIEPAPIPPPTTQPALFPAPAPKSPFSAPAGPPAAHPLKAELMRIIRWADADSPRSRQTAIGPSEIGVDCLRRLAYRVQGAAAVNTTADPWFAIVGTAVHEWLALAIDRYEGVVLGRGDHARQQRFLTERRVHITDDENGISGSTDLFDTQFGRVVDHKIVGATALKKYKDTGPSTVYRKQVHLYGYGWRRAGRQVNEVCIAFYPRSDYLDQMHVWAEPYDERIALDALSRLATVRQLAATLPPALIPAAPDAAGCVWCPFYRPGGPADATGCPGPQAGK